MTKIPETLTARYELLQQLGASYDLLDSLRSTGEGTETEEAFLAQKIESIEAELTKSEAEAKTIISQLEGDPAAWTIARLRYMQGYEWAQAAARAGISEDAAKSRVYRFFQKQHRKVRTGDKPAKN